MKTAKMKCIIIKEVNSK